MATLEEARSAFQNRVNKYEHKQHRRIVYLGDGRGHTASNLIVSANQSYVYARESLTDAEHPLVVKLNRSVRPAFNLPVWVGKREGDPYERILEIVEEFADYNASASIISGLGPHHNQHEFGGGDETFIDSQLLKEGLLKPRSPATSVLDVFGFYHATSAGWSYFSGSTITNILDYIPSSGSRYVTVSYNPDNQQIFLTQGDTFTVGGTDYQSLINNIGTSTIQSFDYVPAPPETNIPLGAALLDANTTILDWSQNGGISNVFPIRMLLGKLREENTTDLTDIYKKIRRSSLTTTGAQSYTTEQEFNVIDGGRF